MGDIRVPKLNTNDTEYTLVEWLAEDGAPVRLDEPVAAIETSKTVEELTSPADGVLHHRLKAGDECTPGQLIAHINHPWNPDPALQPDATGAALPPLDVARESGALHPPDSGLVRRSDAAGDGPVITGPARALLDELGIDPSRVAELDVKVVRRADVERLAQPPEPRTGVDPTASADHRAGGKRRRLSKQQHAVGRTVTLSHQTIPAGYTAIKVDVGQALKTARAITKQTRKLVGIPDLLVEAVAALHDDFPLFFAHLVDENTAELSDRPHIGVTIDLGTGLYIPIIRDTSSVEQIATELTEYRRLAQSGSFRQEHLTGGNFTITLHHDADIIMAIPIVFPGQACALALTSPQQDGDRTTAAIGLAYDHRLVNGRDVVLFLQALKDHLETPETSPLSRPTRDA